MRARAKRWAYGPNSLRLHAQAIASLGRPLWPSRAKIWTSSREEHPLDYPEQNEYTMFCIQDTVSISQSQDFVSGLLTQQAPGR